MARTLAELEEAYQRGTNPLVYIPLSEELRKRRQHDRALQVCREGLAKHGVSVRGLTVLGEILVETRRHEEAIETLRRAADMAPGSYQPTLLLAKAFAQRCEFLEAREALAPLLVTYPNDGDVRQLARNIQAELKESWPDGGGGQGPGGEPNESSTSSLRQDLEDVEGVDAVFEFGLREIRGDIFFQEVDGQELDEDMKVTVIESARLAAKLNFGKLSQIIVEAPSGKIFLRVKGEKGLMAITSPDVKLGRLRYMMDQCLRAASG